MHVVLSRSHVEVFDAIARRLGSFLYVYSTPSTVPVSPSATFEQTIVTPFAPRVKIGPGGGAGAGAV